MNKKGIPTANIIILIFFCFTAIVLLGIYALIFNLSNTYFMTDVDTGAVNLSYASNQTFGRISEGYLNNVDTLGYMIIFSMIILMMGNAYFTRGKYPRLMVIIDFFIMVVAYVIGVYVSNVYETLINSSSYLDIYVNYMPKASALILNLPIITSIIGVVIIVLSYSGIPRQEGEPLPEEMEDFILQ